MLGLMAGAALTAIDIGCKQKDSGTADTSSSGGGSGMTVGFIYVGTKDDYGYNQAHHEGAMAVKAGVPDAKVEEDESIKERHARLAKPWRAWSISTAPPSFSPPPTDISTHTS